MEKKSGSKITPAEWFVEVVVVVVVVVAAVFFLKFKKIKCVLKIPVCPASRFIR